MENNKKTNRQFLYLGFFAGLLFFGLQIDSCRAGANPFIQTVLSSHRDTINSADISKLAKYDVLEVNRFNYADVNGATWAAIKAINPSIEIYLYQMASDMADYKDSYSQVELNDLGRYNVSRGHSMGSVNGNHPEFFLLNTNDVRMNVVNQTRWAMDFGLSAYQEYWSEATITDIVQKPWVADGIFLDGVIVWTDAYSGFTPCCWPKKYPSAALCNSAMNVFADKITENFQAVGQKIFMNRGNSRSQMGCDTWAALDAMSHPPDIIMEEGAFAVLWGEPDHVQFYPEADWLLQVNAIKNLSNSKVAILSHTDLTINNPNGTDNYDDPVTFWQILWYSMCSYHLARHDAPNNAYFMFASGDYSGRIPTWYDEYDRINLGAAMGNYSGPTTVGNAHVYLREFANGWIYVNPTGYNAPSITLPAPGRQLTHSNIMSDPATLPSITTVSVPAHNGVIVLKAVADAPPSAPQGLSVE